MKAFLEAVMALPATELIAPLKRDAVRFEAIKSKKDLTKLDFTKNPEFTAKKFFFPAYETLYTYDRNEQKVVAEHPHMTGVQVLFGLRLCDLNAVKVQDALFLRTEHPDHTYKKQRERTILIGYYCDTIPSEHCFCSSMGLTNYYDLMFRERADGWYLDVGTDNGTLFLAPLLKKLKLVEASEEIPPIETPKRLETHDIDRLYDHPLWKETVENECLSCERCTTMCPTCMCFHIYDQIADDLQYGHKQRTWESCHNIRFSRVSGDHYFRSGREQRFKHRIWHKIVYYPDVFGKVSMCTGCGRCIEHCPTTIDWVEIINTISKEPTTK